VVVDVVVEDDVVLAVQVSEVDTLDVVVEEDELVMVLLVVELLVV
jgi:hypothetical protein